MFAYTEVLMVAKVGTEMNALKTVLSERTQRTVKMVHSATAEVKARQEQYTEEHGEQAVRSLLYMPSFFWLSPWYLTLQNIEELEQAKTNAQAQLELTGQVNQAVMRMYEERQAKVSILRHPKLSKRF
jgi:chromosome segregation ATPase